MEPAPITPPPAPLIALAGPTLEYSNPRFLKARRNAIGGLMLMGIFCLAIGLFAGAMILRDFFRGFAFRDSAIVPLLVAFATAFVGAGDVTCAILIRAGRRQPALWAIPLLILKILTCTGLFTAMAVNLRDEPFFYLPFVLGPAVLAGLVGIGFELGRVWRGPAAGTGKALS